MKDVIRLSDHFSYKRLLRFTMPYIMILGTVGFMFGTCGNALISALISLFAYTGVPDRGSDDFASVLGTGRHLVLRRGGRDLIRPSHRYFPSGQ